MQETFEKICEKCGAENPGIASFCGSCGNPMADSPAVADAEDEQYVPGGTAFSRNTTESAEPVRPKPLDPNAPGAGLVDEPGNIPPPPGQGTGGQPGQAGTGSYQAQPLQYAIPADGNTSGMGDGYPIPEDAKGWTFAGVIPYGLFAFLNGNTTWGAVGIVGSIINIVGIVYFIYIGIEGKQLAWRNRRFDSIQQYHDTMRAWNRWGLIILIVSSVLIGMIMVAYFGLIIMIVTGQIQ